MIPANHPVLIVVSKKDDIPKFENITVNDVLNKNTASSSSAPAQAA